MAEGRVLVGGHASDTLLERRAFIDDVPRILATTLDVEHQGGVTRIARRRLDFRWRLAIALTLSDGVVVITVWRRVPR